MDLANLRVVCIIVTMTCAGTYFFFIIFNYNHSSNIAIKSTKFSQGLNRFNQIQKQEQEGICLVGKPVMIARKHSVYNTEYNIFSKEKCTKVWS